jgi:hypothetical protein
VNVKPGAKFSEPSIYDLIIIIIIQHISVLRNFTATRKYLGQLFNGSKKDEIQEWLWAGVTILIPKNEHTEKPHNSSVAFPSIIIIDL